MGEGTDESVSVVVLTTAVNSVGGSCMLSTEEDSAIGGCITIYSLFAYYPSYKSSLFWMHSPLYEYVEKHRHQKLGKLTKMSTLKASSIMQ